MCGKILTLPEKMEIRIFLCSVKKKMGPFGPKLLSSYEECPTLMSVIMSIQIALGVFYPSVAAENPFETTWCFFTRRHVQAPSLEGECCLSEIGGMRRKLCNYVTLPRTKGLINVIILFHVRSFDFQFPLFEQDGSPSTTIAEA